MKKLFFSLITASVIFSSCNNNEAISEAPQSGTGNLKGVISFASSPKNKAASTTAIPTTGWENINKVYMFLLKKGTNEVLRTQTIKPNAGNTTFSWSNINAESYDLVLAANMEYGFDNIHTSMGGSTGTAEVWAVGGPQGKKLNSDIYADLKTTTLPDFLATTLAGKTPYQSPPEIFVATQKDITIGKDVTTTIEPMQLKREVALMRVRIDRSGKSQASSYPELENELKKLDFKNANASIVIHRMPVGIGLPAGDFGGGIYPNVASDANRVLLAAYGENTFNDADPINGYNPNKIIDGDYTLWRDVTVLPNAPKGSASDNMADPNRKYFIVISALAPKGYKPGTDQEPLAQDQVMYWYGTINEALTPNTIREVNIRILGKGDPNPPAEIITGTLDITIGAPENWNSNIEQSNIDV